MEATYRLEPSVQIVKLVGCQLEVKILARLDELPIQVENLGRSSRPVVVLLVRMSQESDTGETDVFPRFNPRVLFVHPGRPRFRQEGDTSLHGVHAISDLLHVIPD